MTTSSSAYTTSQLDLKIPLHSLTNVQSVVVPSERLIMRDLDHRAHTVSQRVSLNLSF